MFFKNIVFGSLNNLDEDQTRNLLIFLKEVFKYLKENNVSFYFISGFSEDFGRRFVKENNLETIFSKENIFFVNNEYLSSLSDIDREIRSEKYEKSKAYADEYFKIYFLNKIKPEINNENTLFIGRDVWSDAYYLSEYTKVNVCLLKPFITFNKENHLTDLKTIHTLDLNIDNFKEFLNNKQVFDYAKLKSFGKNYLITKSVGKINLNVDLKKVYKKK